MFKANNTNSISTTTTSGTLENSDDMMSVACQNMMIVGKMQPNMMHTHPPPLHLAHLINTTTGGESTTMNETTSSDFNMYQYDFSRQRAQVQHQQQLTMSESEQSCDVVDVGQVLRAAKYGRPQCRVQQAPASSSSALFWSTSAVAAAIAECDSSYADGATSDSVAPTLTPAKLQAAASNYIAAIKSAAVASPAGVPDLVSCSTTAPTSHLVSVSHHQHSQLAPSGYPSTSPSSSNNHSSPSSYSTSKTLTVNIMALKIFLKKKDLFLKRFE